MSSHHHDHDPEQERVVVTSPRRLRERRVLAALVALAFAVGAAAFGYAIWSNSRSTAKAQTTAEQAKNAQTYGLQVFCTVLDSLRHSVGLRAASGRHDLGRVEHYYLELGCPQILKLPPVPLNKTGVSPVPSHGGGAGGTGAPAPSPVVPTGRSPAPARPPSGAPTPTPTPSTTPTRTPGPGPSPSPPPTPLVCLSVLRFHGCTPDALLRDATLSPFRGTLPFVSVYLESAVAVGPDTSNVNGRAIDAGWLKQHGIGFHIFKVTQGVWYHDSLARANHQADAAHGILEARYAFLESDTAGSHPASGAAQCDEFIAACAAVGGGCANHGHVIDVEVQSGRLGPRYRVVADFVARWRKRMPGHPLGVYSGGWYWSGYLGNPRFVGDWLWDAEYVSGSGDPFAILKNVTPGYWHPWGGRGSFDLRQFSSSAHVDGISPCDVSVYPHGVDRLRELWLPGSRHVAPAPPAVPEPATPAGWKPPAEVVALQRAWHVRPDGKWSNLTDAHAQAIRRNHHHKPEQEAVGATPDGVWGPKSDAAYHKAVARTQAALNRGLPKAKHLKVDGWWGHATDAAFRAARHRWYRHHASA